MSSGRFSISSLLLNETVQPTLMFAFISGTYGPSPPLIPDVFSRDMPETTDRMLLVGELREFFSGIDRPRVTLIFFNVVP